MLFLFILVIALGFFSRQNLRYWLFAVSAITAQLLAVLIFDVGFYNSGGDGYITSFVRHIQKNNFNIYGMYSLEIIFGWGIPLYLIYSGYKKEYFLRKYIFR